MTNENHKGYKCLCKKKFKGGNKDAVKYTKIRKSIQKHYDNVMMVRETYKNLKNILSKKYKDSGEFTYNISHHVSLNGMNENYTISDNYTILAHSNKYVLHFIIKPQFNKLNFYDVLIDGIFVKYMLMNPKKGQNNFGRYDGKKVITCVFTLDSSVPIICDFNVNKTENFIIKCIKKCLVDKYTKLHPKIYDLYTYCRKHKEKNKNSIMQIHDKLGRYKILPEYIKNYFYDLRKNMRGSKSKAKRILKNMRDKKDFLDSIKIYLTESIDNFLGLNNNDEYIDESDTDEECDINDTKDPYKIPEKEIINEYYKRCLKKKRDNDTISITYKRLCKHFREWVNDNFDGSF